MLNFSIMALNEDHIDEICNDIAYQINSGVATMPLFCFTINPEGNPVIDKADILCGSYEKFKAKLDCMGIASGVLIQASIGHGWKLNEPSPFQKYTGLKNGVESEVCCPLDNGFRDYIRNAAARIAKSKPAHIMLDDDFRLMNRKEHGCACPLHLKRIGHGLTRNMLWETINNKTDNEIRNLFIKSQIDSLIECAKEIRKGIDSVDPSIPGSYCLCGVAAEGAYEIAKIMSGKGNPVILRVNNANYCAEDPRSIIGRSIHRAAAQIAVLSHKPDILLAETDTCPQNRYSTPAAKLHSHFTFSILEGISGAKHWITRLKAYETKSGIAYRKKLEKYSGFYNELVRITKELSPFGCRIPLATTPHYILSENDVSSDNCNGWCSHILDRFGLPTYFGASGDGVCFFDGKRDEYFKDDLLLEFLSKKIVLDAAAAMAFIRRGFGKYLGVDVKERPANAKNASGELFEKDGFSTAQYNAHEIIPLSDKVKVYSQVFHLKNGKHREILFPGVTVFENELGGKVAVFSGTTDFPYNISNAFGFLNETRKAQLIKILQDMQALDIYYPGDEEVFLKAANTADGKLFCALLDMSLDPIEKLEFITDKPISNVKMLCCDGKYKDVDFKKTGNTLSLDVTVLPFDPIILIMESFCR